MFKQLLAGVTIAVCGASNPSRAAADPLAHTFSIVTRDAVTGEIGAAAQAPARAELVVRIFRRR